MKTLILVFALLLSATAFAQTPHSVKLSYTTSVTACVVNTNVHRSTVSGGGVIGTNFAVVPDTGHGVPATWTDNSVQAGTTYYYTLSSWGGTCAGTNHESPQTAEWKAVIPADPPPCNLPSTIVNGVCTAPPAPPTGFTGQVQ